MNALFKWIFNRELVLPIPSAENRLFSWYQYVGLMGFLAYWTFCLVVLSAVGNCLAGVPYWPPWLAFCMVD